MVKITEPNTPKEAEATDIEPLLSRRKRKKNYLNQDPTTSQTKNMRIQLRLTPAIEEQLKEYAEVKDTSVTDAVERIITQKFHNKKINRNYFNLRKPTNLLIPKNINLLKLYEENDINMVANVKEVTKNGYSIQLFDKQAELFSQYPNELEVVTIQQVNNEYDIYDEKEECFYSTYNLKAGEDKFLNHTGLIILTNEHTEDTDETHKITTKVILYLLVNIYDGELKEAKAINDNKAIELAEKSNNQLLKDFIEDTDNQVAKLDKISNIFTANQELIEIVNSLQEENITLKNAMAEKQAEADQQLQQRLQELQLENQELKDKLNNIEKVIDERINYELQKFKLSLEHLPVADLLKHHED